MVKKIMVSSLGLLLGNFFKQYDDTGNTYIVTMSLKKTPRCKLTCFNQDPPWVWGGGQFHLIFFVDAVPRKVGE